MEVSGHHLQMALQIMLVINMLVTIAFIIIVLLQISDLYLANTISETYKDSKNKLSRQYIFFKEL